jgi:hypothetical protein
VLAAADRDVRLRSLLIVATAVMAVALLGCGADAGTAEGHFRFFSPSSPWNRPLSSTAPLADRSARLVEHLADEVKAEKGEERGPTINTIHWSVPVYRVPADEPTVRVALNSDSPGLQRAWEAVPLPANAQPAAGRDKQLVVWQPSTDKLWEFWHLHGEPGDWRARWGGAIEDASEKTGVYGRDVWPDASRMWGASASSLSLAGGLITIEDLEQGEINHALALAIPDVRAGVYASPAQRTDGESDDPLSLPEGAHLRLPPGLRLGQMGLPKVTLEIARAAQRYGIIVRSKAADVVFYGQDPTPTGSEPYEGPHGFFEGVNRLDLAGSFPWRRLQVLKMQLHPE